MVTNTFFQLDKRDPLVGAGLPAMQTTRYLRYTEVMLSQASQLPQGIAYMLGTMWRHIGRDRLPVAIAASGSWDQTGIFPEEIHHEHHHSRYPDP
ncbi:MAG: transposase [Pseudomonadales bacterium RIFCSPLOWO2_12_60_38]|uniref:Transposase n=1 Tax=Pseudomonas azotoformans TaxID=47878 RepID=A0A4Q0HTI0_PSEAZ|nr:transposase [Pseudomonas sp. WCS374]AOS76263.1 transposase [Pseudomonas fluorescens]EPJ83608.1 hypothetical protein CFT9_12051 [Pseudomonas sp. CFT9]EPL11807.1 hypothetical protein CF150_12198 [Pseudomonas sp. CF150]ETK42273.1 hypothetical protein H098_06830 [Pseudomonas fluorescens FH5]KRP91751.1 transposase [Pseudomonas lactis]KTC30806.1 transposase [Pseudomonas sp. ICMP 19500]OHC31228.1 MAG: transposase [Pseudomonadales bacterium RIFCSPLOWO2_12_60_38]OHC37651.1 MAG: transposase [Pseud